MSIFSCLVNLGIGYGSWIDGIVITVLGVNPVGHLGGILALACPVLCLATLFCE